MEIQDYNRLEEKITILSEENARLKKAYRRLTIFVILFFIIQVYNLVMKWFF